MDFIEGLSRSIGNDVMFVMVDRLSNYNYFVALNHPYLVRDIVKLFMDSVSYLHSMLTIIVSIRNLVFINTLWNTFFYFQATQLCMSFAL